MPWYRVNGMLMHVRGSKKLPAGCAAPIQLAGRTQRCLTPSTALCDWPVGGGRTCDFPMCPDHQHRVGADLDYCPEHKLAAEAANPQPGLFTGLIP